MEVQSIVAHGSPPLKRTLTLTSLIALGIGGIIGAGIFVLTGHAAAEYAGPAIALSFVLSGFACALAGLCYAELASTVPVAGSAYTYAYATMGEFIAWMIGWDLILEYALGSTTVAIGWSGYVTSFLNDIGLHIPSNYASAPFAFDPASGLWTHTGAFFNFPARLRHRLDEHAAGHRHPQFGVGEQCHCRDQADDHYPVHHCRRVFFFKTSNWVTVRQSARRLHSAECGPGPLRLGRRLARRRRRLLLLYRLRCDLDRGAGGDRIRSAQDKLGFTPLHYAVLRGHKDVAELLRKHGGHA